MTAKKIFSFFPYYYSPHLETDLEIIHQHVECGDNVTVFVCGGELPACDGNSNHEKAVCNHCIGRRRNALNLAGLSDKVTLRSFLNLKESDWELLKRYQGVKVEALDQLFSIRLENCLIGKTIYNEMVSLKHETKPDLQEAAAYVTGSIESCALIYLSFKNHFIEEHPDVFYTFNGRFVVSNPAISAARATNTNFAVHDRAPTMNRYSLVHNESLHSLRYWKNLIATTWDKSELNLEERYSLANRWFQARLDNQKQGWFSFTAEQTIDLPDSFDASKINIVIFDSSEWEYNGMDEYDLPFYADQSAGLLAIAESLKSAPDIQIYHRVHPHLKDKVNAQTTFVAEKLTNQFSNYEVIAAGSPVKTYQLMRNANLVITFGSTAGIEAPYLEVPSILLGHALYEDLDACITPANHDELIDIILNRKFELAADEREKRKLNALKYGFYAQTGGIPFKLFEQVDVYEMRLNGEKVAEKPPVYELGLKRELAARDDLGSLSKPNPLTYIAQEMTSRLDKFAHENATLSKEVEALRASRDDHARATEKVSHELGAFKKAYERKIATLTEENLSLQDQVKRAKPSLLRSAIIRFKSLTRSVSGN
jgi:hypothetical protein